MYFIVAAIMSKFPNRMATCSWAWADTPGGMAIVMGGQLKARADRFSLDQGGHQILHKGSLFGLNELWGFPPRFLPIGQNGSSLTERVSRSRVGNTLLLKSRDETQYVRQQTFYSTSPRGVVDQAAK